MKKLTIEEYINAQLAQLKDKRTRIQNAIGALNHEQDKDILLGLLVGRAYLTGAIEEMQLALQASA